GGVYLVNFLNVYGPGLAILFVVFVEAAGVFWFYGVDNFSKDIEEMIGHKPGIFWRVCWTYISPIFLLIIFVFSLLEYDKMLGDEYRYPEWSTAVGWILTMSSILCIPTFMIYKFIRTPGGLFHRVRTIFKPETTMPTAIPGQIISGSGVFWFYGVDNFSKDIEEMIGHKPGIFWRVCWTYISPIFLLIIFVFSLLEYDKMLGDEYRYPEWSTAVGWILTMSSILCIPTFMIYKFIRTPGGLFHRVRTIFKPETTMPTAIPGQIISGSGTAV
ncbi:Sodium-dependent serotonin transporter, partial [Pseudolycoriella hygida]